MKTIAVVSPKGGVSKSTLTVHLATCAKRRGDDAMLLDTDVQMSSCEWDSAGAGLGFPVVGCVRPQVEKFVGSLSLRDYLYIDTAGIPVNNQATIEAIRLANLVLIPVTPSALDMWSLGTLIETIQTRMAITGGALKAAFVITQQAGRRSRLAQSVRQALLETGLPALDTVMTRRKSYAEAAAKGCTVFDLADLTAQAEMLGIADEVLAMLKPAASVGLQLVAA